MCWIYLNRNEIVVNSVDYGFDFLELFIWKIVDKDD